MSEAARLESVPTQFVALNHPLLSFDPSLQQRLMATSMLRNRN
jgi:hypothetical protein